MEHRHLTIGSDDDGTRLDRFIRRHLPGINQGRIEKLLRSGSIRVDGGRAKSSVRLAAGQDVMLPAALNSTPSRASTLPRASTPPKMDPATIEAVRQAEIMRGDGWIALNKPSGLATQGGAGTHHHIDGALAVAFPEVFAEASSKSPSKTPPGAEKPRLVHRLDRDTSGVLVVATTLAASRTLARGFQRHDHDKTYLALVRGAPKPGQGRVDAPLAKHGRKGQEKMTIDHKGGQHAQTLFTVIETMGKAVSLVALRPLTGRTHQLRVHMAAIGHPILGDGKYGGADAFPNAHITRLCLHAVYVRLNIGAEISAPIGDDLQQIFDFFGLDSRGAMAKAGDPRLFEGAGA